MDDTSVVAEKSDEDGSPSGPVDSDQERSNSNDEQSEPGNNSAQQPQQSDADDGVVCRTPAQPGDDHFPIPNSQQGDSSVPLTTLTSASVDRTDQATTDDNQRGATSCSSSPNDGKFAPAERPRRDHDFPTGGQESNAMENIWALLIYESDAEGSDVFKKDCEELRDTLLNCRVANARKDRVLVSKESEAEMKMTRIILKWEEEILAKAILAVEIQTADTQHTAIRKDVSDVYEQIRQYAAETYVLQWFHQMLPVKSKFREFLIKTVREVARDRWKTWSTFCRDKSLNHKQKYDSLCALKRLWSPAEDDEKAWGSMLKTVKNKEKEKLKPLAKEFLGGFKESAREIADCCFLAYVYSCGVPVDKLKMKERLQQDGFPVLTTNYVDHLKPISDSSFWLHYSGHGIPMGHVTNTCVPHLQMFVQIAGRLVSNAVVTLDCCYANGIQFPPDSGVNVRERPSGYTIISACSRDQGSGYKLQKYSYFTKFVVLALWSGLPGSCWQVLKYYHDSKDKRKKGCKGDFCDSCKNYENIKDRPSECRACEKLQSQKQSKAEDPPVTAIQIAEYVGGHLCREHMLTVTHTHKAVSNVQLPLALRNKTRPNYEMQVELGRLEFVVRTHDLPTGLKKAKEQVLGGIYLECSADPLFAEGALESAIGKFLVPDEKVDRQTELYAQASLTNESGIKYIWSSCWKECDRNDSGAFTVVDFKDNYESGVLCCTRQSGEQERYYKRNTKNDLQRPFGRNRCISLYDPDDSNRKLRTKSLKMFFLRNYRPVKVKVDV